MLSDEPFFFDFDQVVQQMFDKLIYRRWSLEQAVWKPPIDVHETPDAYLVEIDLPAVPPADVRITATERSLRVLGQRRLRVVAGAEPGQMERRGGAFRREIVFPRPIEPRRIHATYVHGAYRLEIPKKDAAAVEPVDTRMEWEVRVVAVTEGGGDHG